MIFKLPALPYSYDALEPYIDAKTMEIHYLNHHDTYLKNLNKAIVESPIVFKEEAEALCLESILKNVSAYSPAVRNNAGGHFNHAFFWPSLSVSSGRPYGTLLEAINTSFGSFDAFKNLFTAAAMNRFGSGWAWLIVSNQDGRLLVTSTANQDNPFMDVIPIEEQGIPILGLDVWEHAYYLLYQNKRLDYVEAFWHIIHWENIEMRFQEAMKHV